MRSGLALLLCCALTACAPPRPRESGPAAGGARTKVVVYSPHGDEVLKPFRERLARDHPELELVTLDMGAQDVLDRLRAEQGTPLADVWWGAPQTTFAQGADLGLLEPYEPTWSAKLDPARRDPQHRWYGQYLTPGVIVYNTAALKPEQAPHDWDELLDARFRDKIIIRDPASSGTLRTFIAAMLLRAKSVDEGFAWLKRLDANTAAYPASPALLFRQFQAREGVVTVWNMRDVFIQRRDHGYQLGLVIPKSGCPLVLDGIALVKGAPHPAAARVFYEYVTAPAQLAWAAQQFYCLPARGDIDKAAFPPDLPRELPELKLDWPRIRAEGDGWMKRWSETVKGRGHAER